MAPTGTSDNRRGCFKFGCFGCLGVVALLIGLPLILGLVGFLMGTPEPRQEQVQLSQPLPEAPAAGGPLEDPSTAPPLAPPGTAAPTDDLGSGDRRILDLGSATLAPPPAGTIRLDLGMGEFNVLPAAPGEGVRIEGDYDRASFDLEEIFSQDSDGTWEYTIRFENKMSWIRWLWGNEQIDNEITIFLPRDHPMAVVGEVDTGRSDLELGGLWLTEVDLQLGTGEHDLRFSEPIREPLERLKVDSGMGEINLTGIGNASPARASLEGSFGEFDVDLQGDWRGDSQIAIGFQFGQCRVRLPEAARIDIQRSSMAFGERRLVLPEGQEELPETAPTLALALEGSFGEMRIAP